MSNWVLYKGTDRQPTTIEHENKRSFMGVTLGGGIRHGLRLELADVVMRRLELDTDDPNEVRETKIKLGEEWMIVKWTSDLTALSIESNLKHKRPLTHVARRWNASIDAMESTLLGVITTCKIAPDSPQFEAILKTAIDAISNNE